MGEYKGKEKRKYPRLEANFIVSYRIQEPSALFDLSQTRNVSKGGMLLTTNKDFKPGVVLAMTIRFPFASDKINILGRVIFSKEKVKNLIYETHIQFSEANQKLLQDIGKFVDKRIKDG